MYLSRWNIGLEIHHNQFIAVALQQKRYGWQLRGWWQIFFEQAIFDQNGLVNPQPLIKQLKQWRTLLPKSFSLRLALPDWLILQQPLALPPTPLSAQELSWYVDASATQLFPLAAHELVIDYRTQSLADKSQLLVTASRKKELAHWLTALKQAGLTVQVIDIAPCVLKNMARAAFIPPENLLLHKSEQGYLIVSPLAHPFYFERFNLTGQTLSESIQFASQHYHQVKQTMIETVSISGDISLEEYTDNTIWSPFTAIQRIQAPMPKNPALYTIACGLALREPDSDAS